MRQPDTIKRQRVRIDTELALTSDLLDAANRIALAYNWRVAVRACYYVIMRVAGDRGRRQLAEFLLDDKVSW